MSEFCCESQTSKLLRQLGSLYILLTLTIQAVLSKNASSSEHLTILHTNDFHSKFQQLNKFSSLCKQKDIDAGRCYGGIARIATKVKEIRRQDPNVLLLDAGDQFQGTYWFYHFKGYASAYFMNLIKYDAMCLGNHEFDEEISGLAPFLKNVSFPVVCANINITGIDEMQPVVKRTKIEVGGYQVGIVGYITINTPIISKPGPVVFLDEVESVKQQVKELQKEGVNRIIALGHAGIEMDKKIAREVKGVDIVIGGHTNTFLYTGDPPSIEKPEGSYPVVITQKDGEKVLVVQEFAFGKYLGYLRVEFDSKGQIMSWNGNPILLNNSVEQDPDILSKMEPFTKALEEASKTIIGQSSVLLLGSTECRVEECNLGNLVADSMVFWYIDSSGEDSWSSTAISLVNGGSLRSAIEPGNINYLHIASALPFSNSIDVIKASGQLLLDILEHSVKDYSPTNGKFLQVSGIKVIYDFSKPNGQRVTSVKVRCSECLVPVYENLDLKKLYKISISDFLINGGDGYSMIKGNIKERWIMGMDQAKMLSHYLKHYSPVFNGIEGRITMKNETTTVDDSGANTNRRLDIKMWMMIIISVALTMLHESLN